VVTSEISHLSPSGLARLLRPTHHATDDSHCLMSTVLSPTDRPKPEGKMASQYVLEECCQRVFGNQVEEITKLFGTSKKQHTTSAAADMVFEYRAHRFHQEGKVTDLLSIIGRFRTQDKKPVIYDDYTGTDNGADREQVPSSIFETGGAPEVNIYYRPRDPTWPGLTCGFFFSIPEKSP
jgi:hypothetical protein